MTVCVSPGGRNLYISDAPEREVLLGTTDGAVCLRRDAGGAWAVSEHGLRGKHVSALSVEPTRGLIFAGTHGDGIHASDDGGRTWQRRDAGLGFADIYSVNWTQVDGQLRLYAGTEPAHLYLSTDLGES